MLDPAVEEADREKIAADTRSSIESAGSLLHEDNWGVREMAYEIDHKKESDYRWYRFEAPAQLLRDLDHNLKIADGVMRFRVFRVDPDDPVLPAPPATAVVMAPTGDDDERRPRRSRDY
jgi:small subunit ribosomal protein S6